MGGSSAGGLRVSPVRFAAIPVGDSSEQRLELENEAPRQVRIVNWTMEGEDAGDFEAHLPRLFDLGAGMRFGGAITFRPSAAGERHARLSIQSDLPEVITLVDLQGGVPRDLTKRTKLSAIVKEERNRSAPAGVEEVPSPRDAAWVSGSRMPYPRSRRSEGATPASPEHLPVAGRALVLAAEERAQIIHEATTNIPLAFTQFVVACNRVASAIKDAAKKEAEFAAMLIEVGVGFLAPGVVNGLAHVGDLMHADRSVNSERLVALLRNRDLNKAFLAGAAKRKATGVKRDASAIFAGASPDEYLMRLMDATQAAFSAVAAGLRTDPDEEIVAVWGAFHPAVANQATYTPLVANLVRRFQAQVGSIEPEHSEDTQGALGASVLHKTKAYLVRGAAGARLAILTRQLSASFLGGSKRLIFGSWVDEQFREMALARTRSVGEQVETVEESDVEF